MSWSTDFEDLMPQTVRVDTWTSVSTDGYGDPVYTTSTGTYKARVTAKQELVTTFQGEEEVARTVVWIASTSTFAPSARIRLSSASTGFGPLLRLEAPQDEDGVHHVKAWFG